MVIPYGKKMKIRDAKPTPGTKQASFRLTTLPVKTCAEADSKLLSSWGCSVRSVSPCQPSVWCALVTEEDKVCPKLLVESVLVAELEGDPGVPTTTLVSAGDTSECSIASPVTGMLLGP